MTDFFNKIKKYFRQTGIHVYDIKCLKILDSDDVLITISAKSRSEIGDDKSHFYRFILDKALINTNTVFNIENYRTVALLPCGSNKSAWMYSSNDLYEQTINFAKKLKPAFFKNKIIIINPAKTPGEILNYSYLENGTVKFETRKEIYRPVPIDLDIITFSTENNKKRDIKKMKNNNELGYPIIGNPFKIVTETILELIDAMSVANDFDKHVLVIKSISVDDTKVVVDYDIVDTTLENQNKTQVRVSVSLKNLMHGNASEYNINECYFPLKAFDRSYNGNSYVYRGSLNSKYSQYLNIIFAIKNISNFESIMIDKNLVEISTVKPLVDDFICSVASIDFPHK